MSTIEMEEGEIVNKIEGNGQKSTVNTTAAAITIEASKITLVGDKTC